MKLFYLFIMFLFLGCSSKDASHLPSPLELPGAIISTTIENTLYDHQRSKVKKYVVLHYDMLREEIKIGEGEHLNTLLNNANIKESVSISVKKELQQEYTTMFQNTLLNTEAVMQTFGALYLPKEKTKMINSFSYTQAYNIVQIYLKKHFETFRLSLKYKTTMGLLPLINKLHIKEPTKQKYFYESLWKRYDTLIIEPVVVTIMVKSN